MRKIILFLLILSFHTHIYTQVDDNSKEQGNAIFSNIIVKGKFENERVHLRWAPNKPTDWQMANRYGYQVFRKEFDENLAIDTSDFNPISDTIRPLKRLVWEGQIVNDENKYSAIAMQSIYDKSEGTIKGMSMKDYYLKKGLLDTRYGFCLFSCDVDSLAAINSGLAYVDDNIEEGKTYLYRVEHLIPIQLSNTSHGSVLINTEKIYSPPKINLLGKSEEHSVNLMWDREKYEAHYTAFNIERSQDGKNFKKLNKELYIQGYDIEKIFYNSFFTYADSLEINEQLYHYRIAGVDIYGKQGPWSETIKLMGIDKTPPLPPVRARAQHQEEDNSILLSWQYDENESDLYGFNVLYKKGDSKSFRKLNKELLSRDQRRHVHNEVDISSRHYYVIQAVDKRGNKATSAECKGVIIDKTPPKSPTGLSATIDSLGVVSLSWDWGPESDIYGYKIFFANQEDHEFSVVTGYAIEDTTYTDTITLNTFTRDVFYKVMAVDQSFNYSGLSDAIRVIRPDITRPSPPIFDDYEVRDSSVYLHWARSSSEDVQSLILIKKTKNTPWAELSRLSPVANEYIDENLLSSTIYDYGIVAVDSAGLVSDTIRPIRIKTPFSKISAVSDFLVNIDEKSKQAFLSWSHPMTSNIKFVIYKEINKGGYVMLKVNKPDEKVLYDNNIQEGKEYKYAIKVMHDDGRKSKFSEVVSLKI